MLILQDIRKSFHHQGNVIEVLRGIDLVVNSGDTLAIMGASGVGKSTLLDIMGSLEMPSGGVVKFKDQDIYEMDETSLCRLRNREIGFVFQFHHLLPEFNALENTLMPALIGGYDRKTASGMAKEVLERVGLEKRLTHRTGELSGGEQQRVAIARAIVNDPMILLADEPTGNLDSSLTKDIMVLFRSINLKGATVVVATHSQELLRETGQRTISLNKGRIVGEK